MILPGRHCSPLWTVSVQSGTDFVAYNIHGLVHLCDDVKVHGPLDLISEKVSH